jgi:hypothetical protein
MDNNNNNKSLNQKATQAYKLERKEAYRVDILLGLPENKATKYYTEYWKLTGLYELNLLYEERKHHLPSFLKLHRILERAEYMMKMT